MNSIGWSAFSTPNYQGLLVEVAPQAPETAPILRLQSETSVTVVMT